MKSKVNILPGSINWEDEPYKKTTLSIHSKEGAPLLEWELVPYQTEQNKRMDFEGGYLMITDESFEYFEVFIVFAVGETYYVSTKDIRKDARTIFTNNN